MKKQKIYLILNLFFILQLVFIAFISRFPSIIETYYSNSIYPFISSIFRTATGWISFSIGDIYYFLLGVFLIISIYYFFKNGFKNIKESILKFGAYISIFYFLFNLLWGLNYYKDSLYNTLSLDQKDYTVEDLIPLADELLILTKQTHFNITQNDTIKVSIHNSKDEIIQNVQNGYQSLSKIYPQFQYHRQSIKNSLFSTPLTYMGFSGYYNPLSGEAQVDYLVPKISLPMISSHEVAHQLGFASESEANFIGFLAATHHPEDYYKYSGYLVALRYSIAAIYGKDSIRAKMIIDSIPKGIRKNIKESQDFWKSYQNKAEPFFKIFYDNYLKANQQEDGMKGYSNMVGLLVAYREKNGFHKTLK